MPPVFGHGQLRLYLLALLQEGPRSGYDIIRELQERFGGLYSPSAGTVYPRLSKLEEDGLVAHHEEGRRSVYELTDAGREEVAQRADDLAALHASLQASAGARAEEVRTRITQGAADLRARLEEQARLARRSAPESRDDGADDPPAAREPGAPPSPSAGFDLHDLARWAQLAAQFANAPAPRRPPAPQSPQSPDAWAAVAESPTAPTADDTADAGGTDAGGTDAGGGPRPSGPFSGLTSADVHEILQITRDALGQIQQVLARPRSRP